jgi:hypothetical protein
VPAHWRGGGGIEQSGERQRVLLIAPPQPEAPELPCQNKSDPIDPARRETQIPIHEDQLYAGDLYPQRF